MAKKTRNTAAADAGNSAETLSFEDALGRVESLIEQIESGEIGLEESLTRYEEGVALIKRCRSILDTAEQRVEQLAEDPAAADTHGDDPA